MILGVNIDHVATVRQARLGMDPDPIMAVPSAILGGADGITIHLREDRRHIQDRDLHLLRQIVPVELNLEMAATDEMLRIAIENRPDLVTIVPEKRREITTEGGIDLKKYKRALKNAIRTLRDSGLPVSLFVNPSTSDVEVSREIGADMVEIHTGSYANEKGVKQGTELLRVMNAVRKALDIGLQTNAGHGLNYQNVIAVAEIQGVRGIYIGHSIISRALFVGLERAVKEMKELIQESQISESPEQKESRIKN